MPVQELIGTREQQDKIGQDHKFWKRGLYSAGEFLRAAVSSGQRASVPLECHNGIKPVAATLETNIQREIYFGSNPLDFFVKLEVDRHGRMIGWPVRENDWERVWNGKADLVEIARDTRNLLAVSSYKPL
jgi:hypothetical protein